MNIPAEVLRVAAQRLWDIDSTGPDAAWDDLASSFRASLMTQVEVACQSIAEWARKEALREAAEAVEKAEGGPQDFWGLVLAADIITALVGGDTPGDS